MESHDKLLLGLATPPTMGPGTWGLRKMDKDVASEEIELAIAILAEHTNLTPDHQRIINAMIRGVFDCGHCGFGKFTAYRPDEYVFCKAISVQGDVKAINQWPCSRWQDQGGE